MKVQKTEKVLDVVQKRARVNTISPAVFTFAGLLEGRSRFINGTRSNFPIPCLVFIVVAFVRLTREADYAVNGLGSKMYHRGAGAGER